MKDFLDCEKVVENNAGASFSQSLLLSCFNYVDLSKQYIAKGRLLLSEPFMLDPNFKRSVVLICDHNESGTVGFILNKPVSVTLNEVLEDFPDFDVPLSLGGPVQTDSLHYLHRAGDQLEGSIEVLPGIFWGGDFQTLQILIAGEVIGQNDVRFFLGYSGWDFGQLKNEIKEKSWISLRAKQNDIFRQPMENQWNEILERNGGEYKIIAHYPEDPQLN